MYKVIVFFKDLQDHNHAYNVGDIFPRIGMKVSESRLKELSTDANRRHKPLIAWVDDKPEEVVEENATSEPVEGFMNPPEEAEEPITEEAPKLKKKRGRPRNDAE